MRSVERRFDAICTALLGVVILNRGCCMAFSPTVRNHVLCVILPFTLALMLGAALLFGKTPHRSFMSVVLDDNGFGHSLVNRQARLFSNTRTSGGGFQSALDELSSNLTIAVSA